MKKAIAVVLLLALMSAVPAMAMSSKVEKLLSTALEQMGAPYELYSDAPNSFNCFTFVTYCVNEVEDGKITWEGIDGSYKKITSIKRLKSGDIICFKNSKHHKGVLGYHFGIYLGKGYFIHAANQDEGVTIDEVKDFKKRFIGAIRLF